MPISRAAAAQEHFHTLAVHGRYSRARKFTAAGWVAAQCNPHFYTHYKAKNP